MRADKYERIIDGDADLDDLHEMKIQFISDPANKQENTIFKAHITDTINPSDPRAQSPESNAAKKKELEDRIRRGTWKVVAHDEIPGNANILTGGFVITIIDTETDQPRFKARFVAHGNRDRYKSNLVHIRTTLKHASTRIIIALAACFGLRIWSQDISQTYLQSASQLISEIYLKPGKDLQIEGNQLLKLLRPLYGLSKSGDYWNTTFSNHIKNDLKMANAISDYSSFFKTVRNKLIGLAGTYVDDIICAGNN